MVIVTTAQRACSRRRYLFRPASRKPTAQKRRRPTRWRPGRLTARIALPEADANAAPSCAHPSEIWEMNHVFLTSSAVASDGRLRRGRTVKTQIKTRKTWLMAGAAVAVVAIGGGAFLLTRDGPAPSAPVQASAEAGHEGEAAGEAEEGVINLTPAQIEASGITVMAVGRGGGGETRLAGRVEPMIDARAAVAASVGGRVERVLVAPGQSVRAGQPLAVLGGDHVQSDHRGVRPLPLVHRPGHDAGRCLGPVPADQAADRRRSRHHQPPGADQHRGPGPGPRTDGAPGHLPAGNGHGRRQAAGRTEILRGLTGSERVASANAFLLKAEMAKGEAEHGH
uniref:Biotin_lipoyl_2 domain-containing protein n=1 Tax=Parastrongyloides trichosuri TaxID=131310 RepID=A0A0N5A4P1_PARTI